MESNEQLDRLFFALSDQRRRAILEALSEEKKSVGELAEMLSANIASISKQLVLLEKGNLIYKTKIGRKVYCHMNFDIWKEVAAYISMQATFWNKRLDELEAFVSKED